MAHIYSEFKWFVQLTSTNNSVVLIRQLLRVIARFYLL